VKRLDFFILPFAMDVAVAMSQIMVNLRALDLGASATEVGLLMGLCWGVAYMLTALATGRLVGRFGAKAMMLVGAAGFGIGTAAYGFALSPWHLLAAAPVAGAGSGIFWPSLQTFLKVDDDDETRIRSGIFNVSWTFGILTGVGVSGHAYSEIGPRGSFWMAATIVAAAFLVVAWRVRPGPASNSSSQPDGSVVSIEDDDPRGRAFLRMAWVANFTMWFVGSSAATVFPRLARSLNFSDGAIGEMAAVVWIGQVALFGILATGSWWHFRKAAFIVGLLAGVGAMAMFARGASALVLVAASALLGASRTPSHVGSMHYGLHSGGNRDANMGYHEAILGAGCVLGPVLSGLVADAGGVRAPFVLGAAAIGLTVALVTLWPVPHCRQRP
jgi:MFS family permease